jgi:alginate O-acetyltransferase complex protein AlgI
MFVDPQLHIICVLVCGLFNFLIPTKHIAAKQWNLILFSFLVVFYAAPVAAIIALLLSCIVSFLSRLIAQNKVSNLGYKVALLIPVSVIFLFEFAFPESTIYEKLGSSYYAIKSITVLVDSRKGLLQSKFRQIFLLNIWFPTYSAGPIERAETFSDEKFANIKITPASLLDGCSRVLVGLFKIIFIGSQLLLPFMQSTFGGLETVIDSSNVLHAYIYILLLFILLYINFSGYTDIAIGTSKLFGIDIKENFDRPFLSTSIQNFWQRWHLSLSKTISRYLFLPFVRATGKPTLGIFLSFVLIGLWHQFSINYLLWGVLHGAALAINFQYVRYKKRVDVLVKFHQTLFSSIFFRVVTILYVAWVSAIANADGFDSALQLTGLLVGLH